MKVRKIKTERLVPDNNNARLHPDENLTAIRESLSKFGQLEPLIVRESDMTVISGNGRLSVMQELGIETVYCVLVADITDDEAVAMSLAINRAGDLAGWDIKKLKKQVEQVADVSSLLDVLGALEFDDLLPDLAPLDGMLPSGVPDPVGDGEDDDENPEPVKTVKYRVTVTLDDVDAANELADGLIEAGFTEVGVRKATV